MMQVNQQSNKKKFLNSGFSSWPFLIRDRLGIFALILFILGLVFLVIPVDTLRGVGGILFGTGLTVVISTWNNREQSAKDANLRRKTDIYGPLHAELQNLRDRLLESSADDLKRIEFRDYLRGIVKPCLQHIDVPEQTTTQFLEEIPRLHCWPEYKTDYRSLDFSESSRQILNQVYQFAMIYNTAVDAALGVFELILAPHIKEAIARVQQSGEYGQWLE